MLNYHQDIPKPLQPKFVLDVEMDELFILAGLQDRVIQVINLFAELFVCPLIKISQLLNVDKE